MGRASLHPMSIKLRFRGLTNASTENEERRWAAYIPHILHFSFSVLGGLIENQRDGLTWCLWGCASLHLTYRQPSSLFLVFNSIINRFTACVSLGTLCSVWVRRSIYPIVVTSFSVRFSTKLLLLQNLADEAGGAVVGEAVFAAVGVVDDALVVQAK